jgi:hypothetical protein
VVKDGKDHEPTATLAIESDPFTAVSDGSLNFSVPMEYKFKLAQVVNLAALNVGYPPVIKMFPANCNASADNVAKLLLLNIMLPPIDLSAGTLSVPLLDVNKMFPEIVKREFKLTTPK